MNYFKCVILERDLQNGFDPNELVLYLCIGY